jgi:glucose-1-phosphate thymidylyltransferase
VIGLVLAARAGRRLHPLTADLPKTLLEVEDGRTVLDVVLANLRRVGVDDVAIVTGVAPERIRERAPALEHRQGVRLELIYKERAEE